MLKIIRRKIDIFYTIRVFLETPMGHQLKVVDVYGNNGNHDMHIFLAQEPQRKFFKHWKHLAWKMPNEDEFNSLDEMYINITAEVLANYECEVEIQNRRKEKWKVFEKTLDK